MPSFKQGDVIRLPFSYTDRSTRQHRPALVVSKGGIGEGNGLLWVAMITSAENHAWPGDVSLSDPSAEEALPVPSVIRPCKLATIEVRHAERHGHIEPALMREVASEDIWVFESECGRRHQRASRPDAQTAGAGGLDAIVHRERGFTRINRADGIAVCTRTVIGNLVHESRSETPCTLRLLNAVRS